MRDMDWDYIHFLHEAMPHQTPLDDLFDELDYLIEDWENFFKIFSHYASPPKENKDMIKRLFKELQTQHSKCKETFVLSFFDILNNPTPTYQGNLSVNYKDKVNKDKVKLKEPDGFDYN